MEILLECSDDASDEAMPGRKDLDSVLGFNSVKIFEGMLHSSFVTFGNAIATFTAAVFYSRNKKEQNYASLQAECHN